MDLDADRGRDHAAHQGDPAGAPLRPAGRHGSDPGDRAAAQPDRHRGRGPGARRRVQGPARRAASATSAASASTRARTSGAYGEGGMVTTGNPEYARTIRMLRDWGQDRSYQHVLKGFNYRLEGIQGAILRVKLRHLEDWTDGGARARASTRNCWRVPASGRRRDGLCAARLSHLRRARGGPRHVAAVAAGAGRPERASLPDPGPPAAGLGGSRLPGGRLPARRAVGAEELSLPMFAELTPAQIETVANAVRAAACAV